MTTSSRTDRTLNFSRNIQTKPEDCTRIHTDALRTIEYERTRLFKAQGANCFSCTYHSKELYTHYCTRPEKAKRQINPLSICSTFLKEFVKT